VFRTPLGVHFGKSTVLHHRQLAKLPLHMEGGGGRQSMLIGLRHISTWLLAAVAMVSDRASERCRENARIHNGCTGIDGHSRVGEQQNCMISRTGLRYDFRMDRPLLFTAVLALGVFGIAFVKTDKPDDVACDKGIVLWPAGPDNTVCATACLSDDDCGGTRCRVLGVYGDRGDGKAVFAEDIRDTILEQQALIEESSRAPI
jgi:hypothetical protein